MEDQSKTAPFQTVSGEDQVPENEVRQVKDLLMSLLKAKRAIEMYPSNNPMLLKFTEDVQKRFETFLGEYDNLRLIIKQYDIHYKGQQVYHSSEKEDNLALFFFKDGLRELNFAAGFSGDEVLDFIDVIRARPDSSQESFDDDIVTLLWEKDFVNLSYYVVDAFIEGSALEEDEVSNLLSRHKTSDGELSDAYNDAINPDEEAAGGADEPPKEIFSPLESISMGFRGIFTLGEEEVKSLKEEMEGLTDEKFLEGAIYVLFESIYLDKGTSDFKALLDNLDSALSYLIYNGGFRMASLILSRFRELAGKTDQFSPSEIERIKASIVKSGSEQRIRSIAEVLNSGRDINSDDFRRYISLLDRSAILSLSNLMGEVQEIKYRKVMIDALVVLGRDNIDVLAAGLKDKRWFVVRNVAAILGRIGDKAALEHLRQAMNHPEPRVRREIIRSLGLVGGPKAGELLLQAMEDPDPQIRVAALRYLPAVPSSTVLDSLVEVITRPDFGNRALTEKRVIFEVLAEIGQDRALPFMLKLFRKKVLFGGAKNEETRISAAYGLGNIHHTDALGALKSELSRAKKGSVLFEAISYSIHKLSGASNRQPELA